MNFTIRLLRIATIKTVYARFSNVHTKVYSESFKSTRAMATTPKWGYNHANGPDKWGQIFREIDDYIFQSPIDIRTDEALIRENMCSLRWIYGTDCCSTIENTGHSLQVSGLPFNSFVTGGPLGEDIYRFAQFHIHWGEDSSTGSEHTINGRSYSGEIHIVSWNSDAFTSMSEATKSMQFDGVCVMAIFLKASSEYNTTFEKITELSQCVISSHSKSAIEEEEIDINDLLPRNNRNFFYYEGSLTTPPCTECVKWIVFQEPLNVHESSIAKLRQLMADSHHRLEKNHRPPQPLNGRRIYTANLSSNNNCDSSSSDDSDAEF